LLQQSASGLGIDQNLQRHRAVSLRQHGFLVILIMTFVAVFELSHFLQYIVWNTKRTDDILPAVYPKQRMAYCPCNKNAV